MSSSSLASGKIGDIIDLMATVRYLNEALFLAAGGSGIARETVNALQAVSEEIENRLLSIEGRLKEVREELR